jgi:ADP-heptose:LPS heptosyltransferase
MPKVPRLTTRIALGWSRRHARRFPPQPLEPLPASTSARILVVNTTGIGDTIFCTAPIADLRKSFPKARIDMLVDRRRLELVEDNPRLSEVVVYPGKFKRVRATVRKLREREYDVAIIQHANDPDVVPMVASARPKHIVGYESHTFSELYSVKLPPADREGGAHTIDARLALTRAVGASGTHWHTELFPDDGDRGQAAELLGSFGLEAGKAVALNIGGSLPSKRWPVTCWAALARVLAERRVPSIFVGGPDDALLAEMVREHVPGGGLIHFAVGKLPFMGSTALLSLCAAHISGDTGLLQAGLAVNVATVALFGPDDPKWTGPHPKQEKAIIVRSDPNKRPEDYDRREDKDGELMKLISVDEVVAALAQLGV